jgi:hypothetical protein
LQIKKKMAILGGGKFFSEYKRSKNNLLIQEAAARTFIPLRLVGALNHPVIHTPRGRKCDEFPF